MKTKSIFCRLLISLGSFFLLSTSLQVYSFYQTTLPTIFSISWSPDGTKIAVTRNSYIDIFNASNGTLWGTLSGPKSVTNYVDWSPDGSKLAAATAEYGNGIYVWNVTTNQIIATQSIAGESLKWNPDSTWIAVTSINNVTKIWNTLNGQVTDPIAFGGAIDWSPDGTRMVNGIYDQNPITVTNVSTGQQVLILSGHSNGVQSVDWSPDGTRIASGGSDNTVRVWNASTGTSLLALTGHTDVVTSVAWNSNNSTLASGSGDGTVRLWNTQTGQSMGIIQAGGVIRAVAWSPDGKKLAYGGDTGVVQTVELNSHPNSGTGLRVLYFDKLNFVAPKDNVLTPTVNFNWGASAPTGIGVDTFSARWVGKIEPLFSESYTFYVTHDDGARLWVNGQQMVNNWTNVASAVVDSGTITLAAGVKYDITLEYYENTGNASVKLEWQSASQVRQVVPKTQLYAP